jgi:hypothetical protein
MRYDWEKPRSGSSGEQNNIIDSLRLSTPDVNFFFFLPV